MLTQLDPKHVDWAGMPISEMAKGNALDAFNTLKLYEILIKELEKLHLINHYKHLLSPLIPILADIESRGMLIDTVKLDELKPKLEANVEEIKSKLYKFEQVKPEDNISSTRDLREIFFTRESGFGLYPPFRTKKTNEPQVDKNTLDTLETMIEDELRSRHAK